MNPMVISDPWTNYLDIIALHPVKRISEGLPKWSLVPLGINHLILFLCVQ